MAGMSMTGLRPEELIRQRKAELEIEEMETAKAGIAANQSLPDWKKKMMSNQLSYDIRKAKLKQKSEALKEVEQG